MAPPGVGKVAFATEQLQLGIGRYKMKVGREVYRYNWEVCTKCDCTYKNTCSRKKEELEVCYRQEEEWGYSG